MMKREGGWGTGDEPFAGAQGRLSAEAAHPPSPVPHPAGRLGYVAILLLAILSSAPSLTNAFAFDDVHIVQYNDRVHALGGWWRLFGQSYWPPSHGATLYRPLTMMGFAAQWAAGGGSPPVFHAASVLLYALACLLVLRLARALLEPAAAWAAAALFAVHPVHVEAVGNVVGQSELWAAIAVVAAVGLYLRVREAAAPTPAHVLALSGLYAAGCLAKEHAIVLPALLLAAELTVVPDARAPRERAAALRPLYLALGAVAALYLGARELVTGGVTYDDVNIAFAPQLGGSRPLTILGLVPEWARLLLWPARLSADYSPQQTPVVAHFEPRLLAGVVLLAAAVGAAVAARRRLPAVTFGLAWTAATMLLVSNLLVPTGVLLAERTLFLPSVGAALAAGGAVQGLAGRWHSIAPALRAASVAGLALLLGAGVVRSAERQRVWRDTDSVVRQTLEDAPLSYTAHQNAATLAFLRGLPGSGEREMRIAMRLMPYDANLPTALADRYREAGLCAPAVPLYRAAIALAPPRVDARAGLAACLLALGEPARARAEAQAAIAYGGRRRPELERLRAAAERALRTTRSGGALK